ncbi:MAG: helix-turn-helix domain-containing protein [Acutalibacteraceae bacterium]
MTHELIAKIIYSDRVSVSRAVSELEKRGLIRLRNSEYCILDFVGLTDIVEE